MTETILTLEHEVPPPPPPPPPLPPRRNVGSTVRGIGIVLAVTGLLALGLFALRQRINGTQAPAPVVVELQQAPEVGQSTVPVLRRVMLSTGGVGYFEYEAEVTGNAELLMPVRMDQVDDILKSIVVFDAQGNTGFVQLPSRAPLSDIFRGLPFGPGALESNAGLIAALKGAEVSVRAGTSIEGRIISVNEETASAEGDRTITRHRVGVMTADGLKQFVLEDANSVSFADPVLNRQIGQALAAIAEHREGQGRTLKIRLNGSGTRKVTVAYVVETPLWKSSYRATTLDPGTARLQGWAILENVTGNDWTNIDLTVVTGNPVTFRQALYATYYVNRPEVPVEIVGRILPRPDQGGIAAKSEAVDEPLAVVPPPPPPAMADYPTPRFRPKVAPPEPLQAQASESMTQVTFRMPFPVTVMNGQSLAVPIVDKVVPGEQFAVYQLYTTPRQPLAALKLTNSTGLSLPPGVLTLYRKDDKTTSFVGDAQLASLPNAESRMLGFALDPKVLVDRDEKSEQTISRATMANGIFRASIVDQRTTVYTLKAAQNEDRRIVIEHPRQQGWELVTPDPKAAEMTDIAFRIPVDLKAGSILRQTITTQWARTEEQLLTDLEVDVILAYAGNTNLTPAQRNAFNRIADMKKTISTLQAQLQVEASARDRVYEEQGRIRDNIKAVPAGSDLQARYLKSMGDLEDQAETHKRNIDRLEQQLAAERQKLADYVSGLQL
ncbi:MAG: DUF4139 domain-containing protein [Alphaproteobacteria bacterium]